MPFVRRPSRALRFARPLAVALLALAVARCTESVPTAPRLEPGDASFASAGGLTVSPATDSALVGQTRTLTVSGLTGGRSATWTSSDSTVATVVSTGAATAVVTARAPGRVTITATSLSKSGTATVVVSLVPVRAVTIAPDSATLQRGDSVQLAATPRDSAGQPLAGRAVTWSSLDTAIAAVTSTGLVTARAHGTARIRAVAEGVAGQASIAVAVPQFLVPGLSTADSANVGDTLVVRYTLQNLGDTPVADSVVVRIGLRSTATGAVTRALRRTLPRLAGGGTRGDSVRIATAGLATGAYTAVAFVDCRDVAGATEDARLSDCVALPYTAGTIPESVETDNAATTSVVLRGAEITGVSVAALDTALTRTTASVTIGLTNAGSATPSGFDVVAGLFDVTANRVVGATAVTVAPMASRETRSVVVGVPVAADADPTHRHELRAWADCGGSGTPAERLVACSTGGIMEANEGDNGASRAVVVASNVARLVALPDTIRFVAIGDTASLTASAIDRAGAPVSGVVVAWASLDSAATVSATGAVRALRNGTARVVGLAEGVADTSIVVVAQVATRVVATPDSAVITSLGDTVRFAAVASDRMGVALAGATVAWSSLDPAIATVSGAGAAVARTSGRARLVATVGAAADTVLLVAAQQVASVIVTPDSTLLAVGGTATLTALVRDPSGSLITDRRPGWTSLDPAVATVGDSGRVSALGAGVARVVAARDGVADTTVVFVNPAGYTHRWLGANALGWTSAANWYPHAVPSGTSAGAYLPADAAQRPYLSLDATVGRIRVAPGTALNLRGHVLNVYGDVLAAGSIDSGQVEIRASGTLAGTVPTLSVRAPLVLAGRTVTNDVMMQDSARVTVNGNTLVTSWLGIAGDAALLETNPLDSVIVLGAASFNGTGVSALSAGILRVDGMFSQFGPAGSFAASGTHTTVLQGTGQQSVRMADSLGGFNHLDVLNNGYYGVRLEGTTTVRGRLRLANGGRLSSAGSPLRMLSRMPDVAGGTYEVETTLIAGDVTLLASHVIPGAVVVDQGGALTLGGHTLDVRRILTANGTLTMSSSADTLLVREGISFYGREVLTAGTLIPSIGMYVGAASGVAGAGLNASAAHTTVLRGGWQSINVEQSGAHFLGNVRMEGGANVQLATDLHVRGLLTLESGATLTQPQGNTIYYHGPLPDAARGSYQVATSKLMGSLALAGDVVIPTTTNLFLGDSATLDLNGHKLDVGAFWTGGPASRFVMPGLSPAESLVVRDRAYLWGALDLRGGVIADYGDLTQMSAPAYPAGSGTKVVFLGARPHQIFSYAADSVSFADLELRDSGTLSTDRHLVMKGRLTLGTGSRLTLSPSAELRVDRVMPDVERGTLDASTLLVRANVSMDGDRRYGGYPLMMRIGSNARLRMNGHTLDVGTLAVDGMNPSPGVLVMDNALDTLVVRDRLLFFGFAELGAGTLVARGDVYVDPNGGYSTYGTHTTVLAGTVAQHLQMAGMPRNWFNNMQIDNAAGVDIDADLEVRGQLRGTGAGVIRSTMGRGLTVFGGVDVAGMVFDGVPLRIADGALTRFDNVTFTHFAPAYPGRLRVSGRGNGVTFTMNNLRFLDPLGTGGSWLDVADYDSTTPGLILDITSPQWADGPAATLTSGGAAVTWRMP